jgi:hypothetical protein
MIAVFNSSPLIFLSKLSIIDQALKLFSEVNVFNSSPLIFLSKLSIIDQALKLFSEVNPNVAKVEDAADPRRQG